MSNNPMDYQTFRLAMERRKQRTKEKNYKILLEQCTQRGYTPNFTEDECLTNSKISFICPVHGEQHMYARNLMAGRECFYCSYITRKKRSLSKEEVIARVQSLNNNKLLNPDDYQGSSVKNLRIRCGLCGEGEFVVSLANYSKEKTCCCSVCSKKESKGQTLVREYLESRSVRFEQEKRFDGCRNKRPLPFDFYLPDYNTCIEFDGQGHYFDKAWGMEHHLGRVKELDNIKDKYCLENGIRLIRIPYFNGHQIPEILDTELNMDKDIV